MRRVLVLLVTVIASVACMNAEGQIAAVTSSADFQLRGATITAARGVPSWPVLAGDTVKAGTALTIVTFADASVLTLNPGSVATIDVTGGTPVFRLLKGSASYSLKSLTSVELLATDRQVNVTDLQGSYGIGTQKKGGFWTTGHTAAVVGVAGGGAATALALGYGAAANSSGPQVSPSR